MSVVLTESLVKAAALQIAGKLEESLAELRRARAAGNQ